jgi:hypothetical protein
MAMPLLTLYAALFQIAFQPKLAVFVCDHE